jgi:hypothetical protein
MQRWQSSSGGLFVNSLLYDAVKFAEFMFLRKECQPQLHPLGDGGNYFPGFSNGCGEVGRISVRLFSVMMAIQFVVVLLWYPETKGITLEDMQKRLGIA